MSTDMCLYLYAILICASMYERIMPYWCYFWWKWRERERELYTRIWLNGSIKILLKVKDKHKNGKLIFSDVKKEKKKE